MKSTQASRTLRFHVEWDETREGARANAMDELRSIMNDRDHPIPFDVRGASAKFGSYTITRIIGGRLWK